MLTIPFFSSPAFVEEITLDGAPHVFRFEWNTREACWSMSLYTLDKQPVLEGVKIVPGENLLEANPGRPLPPGALYAVPAYGTVERVGREDLPSGKVELVYVTEAERGAV